MLLKEFLEKVYFEVSKRETTKARKLLPNMPWDKNVSILQLSCRTSDRDANHSDFCGIITFFKANFRVTISDVKIPQNNDFKMVPDKIKDVTLTCTPFLRTFYIAVDIYT